MGASERFSRTIPKDQLGDTTQWELKPLAAGRRMPGPGRLSARTPEGDREQNGYEAGLAQGRAEALRLAQQARAADAQRLEQVLGQLRSRFDELADGTADILLELALDVAAQVLRHEVQTRRDVILPVVREALALVIDSQAHPTLRLAPADFALVRDAVQADGRLQGCRCVADPAIAPGGCRVESANGEVDATLAARWQRVVQTLGCTTPAPDIPQPALAAAPADGAAAADADPGA